MAADGLEERFRLAALETGMTEEEATRAAKDAVARSAWRSRRGRKECVSCHEAKKITEFQKDSSRRDGLRNSCRKCRSVQG